MKKCTYCRKHKPLDEFYQNKSQKDGKQSFCKPCGREQLQRYRKTNAPAIRKYYQILWSKRGLREKIWWFRRAYKLSIDPQLTTENVRKKFGASPMCYLTGKQIDLNDRNSYQLDHILPISRGGDSSLSNCGLTTRQVNQSKRDMTTEEFQSLCRQVHDFQAAQASCSN